MGYMTEKILKKIEEKELEKISEGLMSFDGYLDMGNYKDIKGEFWLVSRKLGLIYAYLIENPEALKKVGGTSNFYHTYQTGFVSKLQKKLNTKVKKIAVKVEQPSFGKGKSKIIFKSDRLYKSGATLEFNITTGQIIKLAAAWLLPFNKFKGTVTRVK